MKAGELRQRLRERQRALRRAMSERRRAQRERLAQNPLVQRERRRRRLRQAVGLALLLLLALFFRCDCAPPPAPIPEARDAGVADAGARTVTPTPPLPGKRRPRPLVGVVEPQPRGRYQGEASGTPSWLDEYRLQVAARSPRLAECFTGSERPGALRWSAAVNPKSGGVSDHSLEPVAAGPALPDEQRACVLGALSTPPYKLTLPKEEAAQQRLPRRIGIVIEF